jgi:hypothetical protein
MICNPQVDQIVLYNALDLFHGMISMWMSSQPREASTGLFLPLRKVVKFASPERAARA